jgi:hypothetical protein
MALKTMLARKAVKSTAKHTARGTASKLKRDPVRTTTLLALGALVGAAGVWLLGRLGGSEAPDHGGPSGTAASPTPSPKTNEVPA